MAVTLAVLGVGLATAPAASACTPGPGVVCQEVTTNAQGIYRLVLSPGLIAFAAPTLKDCTWQVEADRGDGTGLQVYPDFNAEVGIEQEFSFPAPGVYAAQIHATNGTHNQPPGGPCPSLLIEITVTYPAPQPPPPPPVLPPEKGSPGGKESTGKGKSGGGGGGQSEGRGGSSGPNSVYWRSCKGDLFAHRVGCATGRKVIAAALEKLDRRGSATVRGFRCRLRPDQARPLTCSRGKARLLGPLG